MIVMEDQNDRLQRYPSMFTLFVKISHTSVYEKIAVSSVSRPMRARSNSKSHLVYFIHADVTH